MIESAESLHNRTALIQDNLGMLSSKAAFDKNYQGVLQQFPEPALHVRVMLVPLMIRQSV